MSLKDMRQQLLSERVQDELRRKWAVRLTDKIIENIGKMIDWNAFRMNASDYLHGSMFDINLKTRLMKLPLGPDGSKVIEDHAHEVQIEFVPRWGGYNEASNGSLSFGDHPLKGNALVHGIELSLHSSWIGMASTPEQELASKGITNPPMNWQKKAFMKAMLDLSNRTDMAKEVSKWAALNRRVLIHELTHLLDRFEHFKNSRDMLDKVHKGYTPAAKNFRKYFNHNIEYNAFYIETLNWILEEFDKEGISKEVINDWTHEQFVEKCLTLLPMASRNYTMLSNANKRRIIQRLSRWYTDVLLPKYRARGKTSFSVKTEKVSPEIVAAKQKIVDAAAVKAKRAAAAEKGKATKALKYGKNDKIPPFIEHEYYSMISGPRKDRYEVPKDARIENGMLVFTPPFGNDGTVYLNKAGEGYQIGRDGRKRKINIKGISDQLDSYKDPVKKLEEVWR